MTNFDYIMSRVNQLTERDILSVLLYDESSYCNWLGKQIKSAYNNWVKTLPENSVFAGQYRYEPHPILQGWRTPKEVGRPIEISFQIWLSKQYNPEEWKGE